MNWGGFFSVFILSTFKFMFAPFAGIPFDLSFLETYFCCVIGGTLSSGFFFLFGKYLSLKLNQIKKERSRDKKKRVHTRINKLIVRTKLNIGVVGICFWAPFFLSVPIGSIIVAKFYSKKRGAFLLVFFGMNINALVMTTFAYYLF